MTTTIKLIRAENGTIDISATLDMAETHLYELADAEANSARDISAAVHAVFDLHKGKVLPMPAICALTLANLGTSPEVYAEKDKAVKTFIRNSPEFEVNKGKNGGVVRVCDKPAK